MISQNIPVLLRTMRKTFSILDNLVKQFADEHADFMQDYKNERVVVDLGVRHEKPLGGDAPVK